MNHVMAKDLTHISIKKSVHLWHCVDNVWKSLTNHPDLLSWERAAFFNREDFVDIIVDQYGFAKDGQYVLPDGFAYADHESRTGNYIVCNGWNETIESILLSKGYLTYINSNNQYN